MEGSKDTGDGGSLRREFSLQDAALFGVGGAIGSGILFAAAGGTEYAGPAVILSWAFAAAMIIAITIPFAEFASMAPKGGISARIGYYSFGSYGGFISGWSLFLWAVMIPPIEAVAVSEYASYYVPELYYRATGFLTTSGIIVSLAITGFFVLLNFRGVGKMGRFNTVLTWIKVLTVTVFIAVIPLFLFHQANFTTPSFILPKDGWSGVFIAIPATGILFSFGGYRQVADMSGEIKNPGRNVPIAIGVTLSVQTIFYILMSVVIVGAVSWNALNLVPGDWSGVASLPSPLADIMRGGSAVMTGYSADLFAGLIVLAVLFGIYSPLGALGVYLTGASRIIYGLTREGALPKLLGKTDRKGVPLYSLLLVTLIGDLFLIPLPNWYSLVNFVVVAAVVNFSIVSASLPIIRRTYPDMLRPFRVPFHRIWSLVAFVMSTMLIYWATFPTTEYAILASLAGSFVYLYQGFTTRWHEIALRNSIWIPLYLGGMILLSYEGSSVTGGINTIQFPYDVAFVIAYGVIFWIVSQVTATRKPLGNMEKIAVLQK